MKPLYDPLFILGSPRSGTTFLGECISCLRQFDYHHEPLITKIVTPFTYGSVSSVAVWRTYYRASFRFLQLMRGRMDRRFAEKTPRHCMIAPFLAGTFPRSQFIHIVRDGRDAVVSHLEKPWLTSNTDGLPVWHPYRYVYGSRPRFWVEPERREEFARTTDLHRVIWNWRRYNQHALELSRSLAHDRYLRIHYETAVQQPTATADAIADFVGIRAGASRERFRRALCNGRADSIGRWKRIFSSDELSLIEWEAGELMSQLGYGGTGATT